MILRLRLEGPMVAFGAVAVDALRPVQDWPAGSFICGLLANALGWRREERERLNRLQGRIRYAALLKRPGKPLDDFQTALLNGRDFGWTTRGQPEKRKGGADTHKNPHILRKGYRSDVSVAVAVSLHPSDEEPSLKAVAKAVMAPARPLFLGRKSCIPEAPIFGGVSDGDCLLSALKEEAGDSDPICVTPWDGPMVAGLQIFHATDRRDWIGGLHAGRTRLARGRLSCFLEAVR